MVPDFGGEASGTEKKLILFTDSIPSSPPSNGPRPFGRASPWPPSQPFKMWSLRLFNAFLFNVYISAVICKLQPSVFMSSFVDKSFCLLSRMRCYCVITAVSLTRPLLSGMHLAPSV